MQNVELKSLQALGRVHGSKNKNTWKQYFCLKTDLKRGVECLANMHGPKYQYVMTQCNQSLHVWKLIPCTKKMMIVFRGIV